MAASENYPGSIDAVAAQLAAAQQHLPNTSISATASHIEAAEAIVGGLGTDNVQAQEVGVYISEAADNLSCASAALVVGRDALSAYTTAIGVSSRPLGIQNPEKEASLSASPAGDTAECTQQSRGVYVTHLQVGETAYTVALTNHTAEYVDNMKAALKGCDVIAAEFPGHNNGQDRRVKTSAPVADIEVEDALFDLADKKKGSRGLILLDISENHPQYPVVLKAADTLNAYVVSLWRLEPVRDTRELLEKSIIATAASDTVRDDIIREQLRTGVPKLVGKAKVGVMVGMQHFRALEGVDPSYDRTATDANLSDTKTVRIQLIDGLRDNGVIDPEQIDTELILSYMLVCEEPIDAQAISALEPAIKKSILQTINEYANEDRPLKERQKNLSLYLRNIADLISSDS